MLEKKKYANGQPTYEQTGDVLTFFYENGNIRAHGDYIDDLMEGEWIFFRKSGQLWQVGNFKNSQKHGSFIRYDKNDQIEYQEQFNEGKLLKK